MKVFGVTLRMPELVELPPVPFAGAAGAVIGSFIHEYGGGPLYPVLGMAAAGAVSTALAIAGANLDAGWRGAGLALAGAYVAFVAGTGLAPLL